MKELQIEIVTPELSVYKGPITAVMLPGSDGRFQVLPNHAPIISTLGKGTLRLDLEDGEQKAFEVEGGVVEVMKNKVIVLLEKVLSGEIQKDEEEDEEDND